MANATKASTKKTRRSRKLKRTDDDFFKKIGSMGGRATAKNKGSEYFSNIAKISHQRRRERAAAKTS